ncbi:hypothetical protein ACJDU8_09740 [Clostridium sp. WILCCON 0269]|uniref:Uncharacterized protein n=1 Tax=Candidatus Clostridium eludens TaxID=3381663 RepID=A0ABW8SKG1_9CLOT
MNNRINLNCKCPNTKCEMHGKCKECRERHGNKSVYCQLSDFRKKVNNFLCKIVAR